MQIAFKKKMILSEEKGIDKVIITIIVGLIAVLLFLFVSKLKGAEPSGEPSSVSGSVENSILESISKWSNVFGVDVALIKAIIRVESNFNPNAVNPSDPSYGLMQVMPILAQDFGFVKDYKKPTAEEISSLKGIDLNIYIGTRQLGILLSKHPFDAAIQMYNVGEHGYEFKNYRNPDYLEKVTKYYHEYQT